MMQWRVALLVCVATASGLMSVLHMYLLSSKGHNSIRVAVEIPLQKSQAAANLELNIQSIGNTARNRESEMRADSLQHSSVVQSKQVKLHEVTPYDTIIMKHHVPLKLDWPSEDSEEGPALGEDRDNYEVLLDTGDYELKERDMDKTVDDVIPHVIQSDHRARVPATDSPLASVVSKHWNNTDTSHSQEQDTSHTGNMSAISSHDGPKHVMAFVMTKEEYYARQATASRPSPATRPPSPYTTHPNIYKCTHLPCLQYLSAAEKHVFNECQRRTVPQKSTQSIPKCQCRFRDGVGKEKVAIVSLPGSGNTWVRGLLEKATGVCTGSIYCDRTLREGGFCGEGLRGSSLVAVKTHSTSLQWRGGKRTDPSKPAFDRAIFLIRNPFRANIAEWNRQMSKKHASDQTGSSHVKYVSNKAFFGEQAGWQALVKYQTHKWRLMIGSNMRAHAAGRPVLVVFFEDLKNAPAPQLARMLEFLGMPSSPDIINITVTDGFTSYYRNHTDTFEHYTAEQKAFVNTIIKSTADAMQDKDLARHIRDYLQH